jgi:endonuclease-8
MPEGDSVAGHARRLRPVLVGRLVEEVSGTAPSLRVNSRRVLGAVVEDIRTVGKNLVIDLSTGYSIRVHLGMSGRWTVSDVHTVVPHGSARLVLATSSHRVTCYRAPTVEVDRTPAVDALLGRLGPDVLGEFDEEEFLRRARAVPDDAIGSMLLNQRVVAGIGNVYKSELLFLEGVHPMRHVSEVSDDQLRALARSGRRLMVANVGPGRRVTTGSTLRGRETWVYGRAGRPCRRCGVVIERDHQGDRVTYWCPRCQPR